MLEEMLCQSHVREVALAERKIEQRIAVEEFRRLDRLEAALNRVRAHVNWPAVTPAHGHR